MEKILEARAKDEIAESAKVADRLYIEKDRKTFEATEKIFRTVYECVCSHLSFSEHPRLVTLQKLNGMELGNILYSDHACSNICEHIAKQMQSEIVQHIKSTQSKFSILIDESTSCSNVQSMIVYMRTLFNGQSSMYFLGLLPVESAKASALYELLTTFLSKIGLTDDILAKQFIAFCSDGASNMIGEFSGVATLLKKSYPNLQSFHCMAHRLELAVKNAVDDVNAVSNFRMLIGRDGRVDWRQRD